MRDEEIRRRIEGFPRWHYEFDLAGHKTPIFDEKNVKRHDFRREHFFDPLVCLSGGMLMGKKVLDLGCNAGFWSLEAIEAGCDFVLGVDGRRMHVDQANFVFEVKGVERDRYEFVEGNVFDFDYRAFGDFDIVLCLGLLYHVSKPVELMERISSANTDLLVIDTTLFRSGRSVFEVRLDRLDEPRDAVDYELVLVPSRQAVLDLVRQFGYSAATLKPPFAGEERKTEFKGLNDYRIGMRRAFFCSKRTDLAQLAEFAQLEINPI